MRISRLQIWLLLFGLEILAGINAGLVFRFFERALAGYLAGTVFFLVGIAALYVCMHFSFRLKPINVMVSGVYLVAFSFPLFLARVLTEYPKPVENVFGLPLQGFHQGSTYSFGGLFLITAIQVVIGIVEKYKTRD